MAENLTCTQPSRRELPSALGLATGRATYLQGPVQEENAGFLVQNLLKSFPMATGDN